MSDERKTSSPVPSALLLAGLACLLVGERVLGAGQVRTLVSAGAGFLLASSLALRMRAFALAVGDARAVELRLLGGYGGVAFSLALFAFGTGAGLELLSLEAGEATSRVEVALAVLWPAAMLVSLLAILFVELVYARMPVPASVELRRVRTSLHAGLSLGLSVVFLMSMNYVASERDARKDVSYFRTTRPSDATRTMVEKLDQKVRAVLFWRKGSDVLGQIEPYFAELANVGKQLSYEVVDVALAPDLARQHRVRDNGNVLLVTGEGDAAKGRSFEVGEELTRARRELKKLDGSFQETFRRLVTPERKLHLTVGHGERNASASERPSEDGASALKEILKRLNLKTEDLGVAQGLGSAVAGATTAVAIMGPSGSFLPEEANALLAYVRAGGRIVVMLDPGVDAGLGPLLDGLGVELLPGTVASDKDHMRRSFTPSDRAIVFSNKYTSHPTVTTVSKHQSEVATVLVEGVALAKKAATGADPKPLVTFPVTTSGEFWRDRNANFTRDADEPAERLNLVAAITIQVPKTGKESEKVAAASTEGRAVIIGDGDFITDKLANNPGNMLLFVDSLAWLVGEEKLSGEVTSEEDIAIEHSREQDKIWFYATTFAVPLPVLLIGVWVAQRRRRKKAGT